MHLGPECILHVMPDGATNFVGPLVDRNQIVWKQEVLKSGPPIRETDQERPNQALEEQ